MLRREKGLVKTWAGRGLAKGCLGRGADEVKAARQAVKHENGYIYSVVGRCTWRMR